MRRTLALLAALALLLGAAACSSDDEGADDTTTTTEAGGDEATGDEEPPDLSDVSADDYVASLSGELSGGDPDAGDLVLAEGEAACVAEAWVEGIGVDRFVESGVAPADIAGSGLGIEEIQLDLDTAQGLIDDFGECDVDIAAKLAETLTIGLDETQRTCAIENIDPEVANALLLTAFTPEAGDGSAEFDALIEQLSGECELPTPAN